MIEIFLATVQEIDAIHHLTQTVYQPYRDRLPPQSSVWRETPADVAAELQLGPIFLAKVDDRWVGSVRCHHQTELEFNQFLEQQRDVISPFLDTPIESFVYAHRLIVLSSHQRQGIGRNLMQAVEDYAQALNSQDVRLEVRSVQPESEKFYTAIGYVLGEVSRYMQDGSPRAYWMRKRLITSTSEGLKV